MISDYKSILCLAFQQFVLGYFELIENYKVVSKHLQSLDILIDILQIRSLDGVT